MSEVNGVRISQLPEAGLLTGAEILPLVQAGDTKQSTLGDLISLVGSVGDAAIADSVAALPTPTNSGNWGIVPFGAEEGLYQDTGTWVRRSDTQAQRSTAGADLAEAWAEGTLPGGVGTKSAREWADDAAQSAAYAGGFETPEYASQSAGNAATTQGQIFRVPLGTTPQTFNWYRRLSSGSELVSPLATSAALAASGGSGLVGFQQFGTGAVTRDVEAKLRERVSVDDYGAAGDNTTDDTAAIQACFDANPNATVTFTGGKTYRVVGTITLVNVSGKNFQGDIDLQGATVNFVTDGSSAATDANMQNGFVVYPTLNATGGDISGLRQSEIANGTIVGPSNGAGFRLANSQNVTFRNIRTLGNRYGIVEESCINTLHLNCTFEDYHNAGVGLIRSLNSNIWYRDPNTAWWNDSPVFISCGFKNGYLTQPLAHILDHGSSSLPQRKAIGCYFYSRWDGYVGSMVSTQFGIVSRNGAWDIDSCWFENVARPVRILEENSLEPTNLEGVAGAQPSGTYAVASFPNGFSYAYSCKNTAFARAFVEQEIGGVRGVSRMSGNTSLFVLNGATGIKSVTTSTNQVVMDDGTTYIAPQGTYAATSFVNGVYIDPKAQWVSWTPTITATSGTITTLGTVTCKYARRGKVVDVRGSITITTNGTGAGGLQVSLPFTAATNGGAIYGREDAVTGAGLNGKITGSAVTIFREGNAYPGADGALIIFSGTYEVA